MMQNNITWPRRAADADMVEAARRLYIKFGGRQIRRIEREMRAAGWRFSSSMLYKQKLKDKTYVGWIERFGWQKFIRPDEGSRLRKRTGARRHFEKWLKATSRGMTWDLDFQRYIYEKLDRITTGTSSRLMIFMPPRHGKSEMVTIRYVAWRLVRDPRLNVIVGSYNQQLANKFSRRIKRSIEDWKALGVASEEKAVKRKRLYTSAEWETESGGVVRAVGVGGGIAGFGAGLVVIDDPVRNRADAESRNNRERVDEWFKSDIYTRLEPKAAIILIMTRWHDDDLAGRLLREMEDGGEDWEIVRFPAIAEEYIEPEDPAESSRLTGAFAFNVPDPLGREPGEALCPERYDAEALKRIKRKLGTYAFSALYQQRPEPLEGGQFKREWFSRVIDRAPEGLRWKRGYDLAVSVKTTADYTASFRVAKDKAGNFYIADGFRKRIEYPEQRRYVIERMTSEEATEHGIEAAMHGKALVQDLRRERGLRTHALKEVRVETDKLTRALAWLNLAEEGRIILVRGPWIAEFLDEIAAFPGGRHDDQVDAVSIAVNMLVRSGKFSYGF